MVKAISTITFLTLLLIKINSLANAQNDSLSFYLHVSFDKNELGEYDSHLLDSCLASFHSSDDNNNKIQLLIFLSDNLENDIWIDYTQKLSEVCKSIIEKGEFKSEIDEQITYRGLVTSLNNLGYSKRVSGDYDGAESMYMEAIELNPYAKDDTILAQTYNNLGVIMKKSSRYTEALDYYSKALEINKTLNYTTGIADNTNNIAQIYQERGLIELAIEMFHECLRLDEQTGKKFKVGISWNNIGLLQKEIGHYQEALESLLMSLEKFNEINHDRGKALAYSNLSLVYSLLEDRDNEMFYATKALELRKQQGDTLKLAYSLNNMGKVLTHNNQINLAIKNYKLGFEYCKRYNDKNCMSQTLVNLANAYLQTNNVKQASEIIDLAIQFAHDAKHVGSLSNAYEIKYNISKRLKDHEIALTAYEKHIMYRDSLKNETNNKASIRQQTKYEFEKAQVVAEQRRNEEFRIQNEKLKRRNNLQYSVIFIAILAVFGLVLGLGFVSVSPKFAEGLIFFAFLVFFEFMLVLTDPFIDSWADGAPAYKLFANALLAGLTFPLHAFFERTLKVRLIKNSRK